MKKIILKEIAQELLPHQQNLRQPVHVVYGGANLFTAETPAKLGKLALKSIETYAPNFVEFAYAMWLSGADTLPTFADVIEDLEKQTTKNAEKVKTENFAAWFAWTIYQKTLEKLKREPVEDFRIDFEDGYGFRPDAEEDSHAISASDALAKSFLANTITPFCGFRIKSFAPETKNRAVRTLNLFLENLIIKTSGNLPENFCVTLPKITNVKEIKELRKWLEKFEAKNKLPKNSIKIEIMVETPTAILDENGANPLAKFIKVGKGRINSAHFGAYDYTSSFGISAVHQHLNHDACNFARQMMLVALSPLNIQLSDSVTIEMPVPIYKGENLSDKQIRENKRAVHTAWRTHFNNVTRSQINGFYQSWDLHPAQLAARYAAVFAFFLESKDAQSKRLKGFIEKATQANMTENTFDDAASANGLLNFFVRALNCGAMSETEISQATSLNANELHSTSFLKIMENRHKEATKISKL
ncbi:MAG TPA: aldolase/citrate lyase family protein [Pyrinomonadaceae bacterium]|mgnify:CR=1 FL=1|nr:aldolase/citrate lyase family protein [Pyrinomonadaceae bacterium]